MNNYKYIFKDSADLTSKEIDDMYQLNKKMYPAFNYDEHKYYSQIKPQKILMVYDADTIVADANFCWRKIYLSKEQKYVEFAYFGILVDSEYHGRGIASSIIKQFQEETVKMTFTGLFGTTQDDTMDHLFSKFNFTRLTNTLVWFNPGTSTHDELEKEDYKAFWWPTNGYDLNQHECVYLGTGPI